MGGDGRTADYAVTYLRIVSSASLAFIAIGAQDISAASPTCAPCS